MKLAAIAVLHCALTVSLFAQAATFESFEGDTAPGQWAVSADGQLSITAQRYKSGERSLLWTWSGADATLTFRDPGAFTDLQQPSGGKPGSALVFWLHNEQPEDAVMWLELLRGDGVAGKCWIHMDFRGWRPIGIPYAAVLADTDSLIDGIRMSAPEGMASGRLHLDYFSPNALVSVPANHQTPWVANPESLGDPASGIRSARDISRNSPWLPGHVGADDVTEVELADMDRIAARSLPGPIALGAGVSEETIPGLKARLGQWAIKREDGIITGRPVDLSSFAKPDGAVLLPDYMKLCADVRDAYVQAKSPDHRQALGRMFVDLAEHFLDQGWSYGSGLRGAGSGYTYRAYPPVFYAMRDVLQDAGLTRDIALGLLYEMGESEGALADQPVANMDTLHLSNQALLPCVSMLPDPAERVQWMRAVRRYYSLVLLNPSTTGPDGSAYHHWMHHFAYASYSMPFPIRAAGAMADTVFRISPEAHERLRRHVYAMAFASVDNEQPPNMNGRAGTPLAYNMAPMAKVLAEMGTPDQTRDIDPEMAGLYMALTDKPDEEPATTWREQGIEPLDLTGHWTMNGTAAALHRRDGWLVSIVGMVKFWRGVEIYGWMQNNNYARYARNGSVFVASSGQPTPIEASGYSYDGWNWCHWPGSTSLVRPSHEIFNGYAMYGNPTAFAGGTRLERNGIWGMDFQGVDVNFRKSAFCFDDRVTIITTDIRSDQDRPAVTTLLQNSLQPDAEPMWVDGLKVSGSPWEQELAGDAAHWLIDNKGTGYYLHPGHDGVHLQRGPQQWTYMIKRYLKNPDDDPIIDYQGRKYRHKDMRENEGYFTPSSGNFTLGYFEHGTRPGGASCAYTMLIDSTPEPAARFAESMNDAATAPLRILQADESAHILWDAASGTTGYVLFSAAEDIRAEGQLLSVSRPCFVMIARDGEGLRLSVASSDVSDTAPITIGLRGTWSIADAKDVGGEPAVRCENGRTVLELPYEYYMPMTLRLAPAG